MTNNDKCVIQKLHRMTDELLSGKYKFDLDIGDIDAVEDEDIRTLAQKMSLLCEEHRDCRAFIMDLAKGKLNKTSPPKNALAAPFKKLHSELRHLTWQIQQIAEGDYSQKVSFSGDFSDAINKMIVKLRERCALLQKLQDSEDKLIQYAEQLDESNKTKDKLFSIIAHDLKGHFNVLMGIGGLLTAEAKRNNADIEAITEYSSMLHDSASNAFGLLVNLLDWARLQSDRIQAKPKKLNLSDIIKDNVCIGQTMASTKNISLEYPNGNGKYPLKSDEAMINTILRNLISNAVRYAPQGGKITVSVDTRDDEYVVSVKNSGTGIPQEKLDKLFSPEEISSTPGIDDEVGTGIGLSVCKEFTDKLGGKIWAENDHENNATFSFSLKDLSL